MDQRDCLAAREMYRQVPSQSPKKRMSFVAAVLQRFNLIPLLLYTTSDGKTGDNSPRPWYEGRSRLSQVHPW